MLYSMWGASERRAAGERSGGVVAARVKRAVAHLPTTLACARVVVSEVHVGLLLVCVCCPYVAMRVQNHVFLCAGVLSVCRVRLSRPV